MSAPGRYLLRAVVPLSVPCQYQQCPTACAHPEIIIHPEKKHETKAVQYNATGVGGYRGARSLRGDGSTAGSCP
eukprot:3599651-Rhodomonas_salina.2